MGKLRVHSYAVSLDGYAAGPDQDLENPMGVGGMRLHEWVFATEFGRNMMGDEGGETGIDNDFLKRGDVGIGATIMGRNMFGPIRGEWPADDDWKGWWGPTPPYHHPVFVLTHHERDPLPMEGGTTFYFVTDGIESAYEQAMAAAGGLDVRLGGGASTVRAYMNARLIDEMHIAVRPVLLGAGERIFDNLGDIAESYNHIEVTPSPAVTHYVLRKI